jgi:hypothetical protein
MTHAIALVYLDALGSLIVTTGAPDVTEAKLRSLLPEGTHAIKVDPAAIPENRDDRAAWALENFGLVVIPAKVSTEPRDYNLTPQQFTWLLAVSGLDDVTDTVLAYAKANNRSQFADLKMALSRKSFHFDVTMGLISDMALAIPAGGDVSPETIAGLWMQAKEKR